MKGDYLLVYFYSSTFAPDFVAAVTVSFGVQAIRVSNGQVGLRV